MCSFPDSCKGEGVTHPCFAADSFAAVFLELDLVGQERAPITSNLPLRACGQAQVPNIKLDRLDLDSGSSGAPNSVSKLTPNHCDFAGWHVSLPCCTSKLARQGMNSFTTCPCTRTLTLKRDDSCAAADFCGNSGPTRCVAPDTTTTASVGLYLSRQAGRHTRC